MSNGNHYHISGYIKGERFRYVAPPDWGDDFETLRRMADELGFPQLSSSTFGLMDGKDIDMDNEINYFPCSKEFGSHRKDVKGRHTDSFIELMKKLGFPVLSSSTFGLMVQRLADELGNGSEGSK